jgi:hypothetical protein
MPLSNITSINLSLQSQGAAFVARALAFIRSISPIYADDAAQYPTYQDAIDAGIAEQRQVIFRGGVTHTLQSNLVIDGPISILIEPNAVVALANDATLTVFVTNTGTAAQYGVFQAYDLGTGPDPSFGDVKIECYGIIDAKRSVFVGTGSPNISQAACIAGRCKDLSIIGIVEGQDCTTTVRLVDCDNPQIDTLVHLRESVLAETSCLKVEGCKNGHAKLLVGRNVAEAVDFNGRNNVFIVDSFDVSGSSAETVDINSSYGIKILSGSIRNPTRALFCNNNMTAPNFSKRENLTVLGNHTVNMDVVVDSNASNPSAAFTDIECPDVELNLTYRYLEGANITGLQNVLRLRHNASRGTTSRAKVRVKIHTEGTFEFSQNGTAALVACLEPQCENNDIEVYFYGKIASGRRVLDVRGSGHLIGLHAFQPSGSDATGRNGITFVANSTNCTIKFLRTNLIETPIAPGPGSGHIAEFTVFGATDVAQSTSWGNGQSTFDTTINKALFRVGGNWVDANGSAP